MLNGLDTTYSKPTHLDRRGRGRRRADRRLLRPNRLADDDVIPSLANIARHQTVAQFVQKVRHGGAIPSSPRDVAASGQMPIFDYLTEAEVASAYAYLIAYPPTTTPPASSAHDSGPHD